LLRQTALAIFRREEVREVLAENFFARIAFNALCTGIPARHMSFQIEHVNGAIDNGFDQQLKAFRIGDLPDAVQAAQ